MCLNRIRTELLCEHSNLRKRVAEILASLHRSNDDGLLAPVLHQLRGLAAALQAHHAHEENVLCSLIPGPASGEGDRRMETLCEEHHQEHSDLLAMLYTAAPVVEPASWQYLMQQQLSRIVDHMASEEVTLFQEQGLQEKGRAAPKES